ncbi:hypothetical protein A5625_10510 [Mycobacterium sp. 1465703.0]|nr:hypothetical protein A5625_10510 [Mycobacterium sp. 1465703.0]
MGVVQRARALFGSSTHPPDAEGPLLQSGADTVHAAGARATVLSGNLAQAHRGFVSDATTRLTSNSHTDTSLDHGLSSAALINQTGARQLDTITDQTRALAQTAPAARSPAAQRSLLQGLRTQVSAANAVVNTTQQQSTTLAGQIRALDYQGGGASDPDNHIQLVDDKHGAPNPAVPPTAIDPRNPFVGDYRFGYWQDVVPPPYVGKEPPPPWTGHRPITDGPVGGPTGFYVPGGKTWADDSAPPIADLEEQYHFRISGVDYTGYTRTDPVDGHRQQWVQYTYEGQRFGRLNLGGSIWAPKAPNEITGELGGVSTGGLAGINPPPSIGPWKPMSLPQIATLSAANPSVQFYMPNDCGGQFSFINGSPVGGPAPPPVTPSIIAQR